MARVEDSPWAIPVAQIASRAGQSKPIDADFPAPSGIGDSIVGIKEGEPVHVSGQFDSIVDGLIFTGRLVAPFVSECTRCLKPIDEDWPVDVTVFFPYESGQDKANGKGGKSKKDDEIVHHRRRGRVGRHVSAAGERRIRGHRGDDPRHAGRIAAVATTVPTGLQGSVLAVRCRSERGSRPSSRCDGYPFCRIGGAQSPARGRAERRAGQVTRA